MAYLSLRYFRSGWCSCDDDVRRRLQTYPLYCYAALRWGYHARVAFSKFPDMVNMDFGLLSSKPHIESAFQVFFMAKHQRRCDDFPRFMSGIHLAAYFGITNLVYAFMPSNGRRGRADVSINVRDGHGCTALAWAAHEGHEEAAQALIDAADVDLDARDGGGRTPVLRATQRNHFTIVERLLSGGANPNFRDFSGASPLSYAAKEGYTTIADLLVRHGADVNAATTRFGANLDTPLSLAAMYGHDEIAQLLLVQPGIQPSAKVERRSMFEECTSLELAVRGKHHGVVDLFLSHADVSGEHEALLRTAAEQGDERVVQRLLEMDVDVNTQSEHGDTPLHRAVKEGHDGVAARLLSQAGVLPNLPNDDGDTAALLAARLGRVQALQLMLAKGADGGARNKKGRTPLADAAEQGYLSVVELLLSTDGVAADSQDHKGRTPLSLAVSPTTGERFDGMGRRAVVRCLLNSGRVDINPRDTQGRTPLAFAADDTDGMPMVELLLEYEELDVNTMDEQGRTPLAWAVRRPGLEDTARLLLERGADPTLGVYEEGEPLLSCAVKHSASEIVIAILSSGGVDPGQRDSHGHTPLCRAAERGEVEIVDKLLTVGGLDANAHCEHGQTPLHHAACSYKADQVVAFLLAKTNIAVDTQDEEGRIPLHHAVLHGHDAVVSLLLGPENVGLNYKDWEGRTPLSLAVSSGHLSIVEKLLSLNGVIPDAQDNTGRTPLSWAVGQRLRPSVEVAKRLLRRDDVNPNAEDEKGWTPLSWAGQGEGVSSLIEVLLKEGQGRVDIDHEDREGNTPLSLALKKGNEMAARQLRAAGARLPESIGESVQRGCHVLTQGVSVDREDEEQRQKTDTSNAKGRRHAFEDTSNEVNHRGTTKSKPYYESLVETNWFDDNADSGRNSDSNWIGTDTANHASFWKLDAILLNWSDIELGLQAEEHHVEDEGPLCQQCKTIDLNALFSRQPRRGFDVIANWGVIDKSWKLRRCAMCRLIAAICPKNGIHYQLCAYSTTATWMKGGNRAAWRHFPSHWVDTIVLGLEPGSWSFEGAYQSRIQSDPSKILPFRFIGRVGSNDRQQLRSLTLHHSKTHRIDFSRARSWINCCMEHHGKRCNASTPRRIPHARFIDCKTRTVVDNSDDSAALRFVALSYVWGPSPKTKGPSDHDRVENAECVIEDAIHVTLELGYRYLWVDRHCITDENEDMHKEQLLHMNAVYENAEVTIVAAAGRDSTFGLPGVSRARLDRPYARVQGHALTAVPREPRYQIKESVWWTRGWTFQECMLSRRRLMFTEHELSYECKGMVAREAVELPIHVHRIAATRYPIHEHMRVFPGRRHDARTLVDGEYIWSCIHEYTTRRLTLDADILNAFLGILQVFAERKPPVYHLCGVPLVREKSYHYKDNSRTPTLLEAFVLGLCWRSDRPAARRDGFPSWSWTGWKSRPYGQFDSSTAFEPGHSIEVSIVPRDEPSRTVSWADFEAMSLAEKASLPQDCRLRITATTVQVSLFLSNRDWTAILYRGNDAFRGRLRLSKDPKKDVEFCRRLVEERWDAIVVGNLRTYSWISGLDEERLILLLVDTLDTETVNEGEGLWERVGVITLEDKTLQDVAPEVFGKGTFLIE
ncbi:hypothetical protein AYO20_11799 [Fonsecaea nubica]|uniref:Heterokaryon incompatibility domain-containing protein n=1 Tax=Fonsecaea nubica TaxID=856822 RepID=A0A178BLF5_9EURO|nr:hypothetical protein AYO20_11799 [Fonsecaea nubica]OAL17742.1 hypothetical protein AYO20_11799 [Fonsecaea nubica]